MLEGTVEIKIEPGLQSRPAAQFVHIANSFVADVYIEIDNKRINAKSVMGLMSLALSKGTKVKLIVDGKDEEQTFAELTQFIK